MLGMNTGAKTGDNKLDVDTDTMPSDMVTPSKKRPQSLDNGLSLIAQQTTAMAEQKALKKYRKKKTKEEAEKKVKKDSALKHRSLETYPLSFTSKSKFSPTLPDINENEESETSALTEKFQSLLSTLPEEDEFDVTSSFVAPIAPASQAPKTSKDNKETSPTSKRRVKKKIVVLGK